MAKTTNWKFYVTPNFVASQRTNTFKTGTQVKNFAVKNQVSCGWIKTPGSTTRHFLIEVGSFQKAYNAISKTTSFKTAGSSGSKKSNKSSSRSHGRSHSTKSSSSYTWSRSGNSNRQRGWTKSSRRAA